MRRSNDREKVPEGGPKPPDRRGSLPAATARKVRALFRTQPYGVLCSQGENQAYGSVVAFAASRDLKSLFFSTPVYTRKFRLVSRWPSVAFVVDNRSLFQEDMAKVEAVTATGRARVVSHPARRHSIARLLTRRHPQLRSFVAARSCAIVEIRIIRYWHVARVQEVSQWIPKRAG